MGLLYTIGIYLYGFGIRMASLFSLKARYWVRGRRDLFREVRQTMASGKPDWKGTVWFHCASLGEFEQGKPVMEQFRELYPCYRLIVTFFSPSGYLPRKTYQGAQGIFYLPLDTPSQARRWIRILKPKLVFFVKYEYWFNYLSELHRQNIPVFIVSARFHQKQPFFRWYGNWFRRQLDHISWFFLQDEESTVLVESLGIKRYTITGDTRFDRVIATRNEQPAFPVMDLFKGEGDIFTGGSTWEPEEELLAEMIRKGIPGLKYIIAPHEVHPERLAALEQRFTALCQSPLSVIRFSALTAENAPMAHVVIVDSIGILARLYRYSTFALIGGAFGTGLHNILEAAAFGNPVFFGPRYHRFHEATELINLGGAFPIENAGELFRQISRLRQQPDEHHRIASVCRTYIENGQGSTRRILQGIRTLGFIGPPETNT